MPVVERNSLFFGKRVGLSCAPWTVASAVGASFRLTPDQLSPWADLRQAARFLSLTYSCSKVCVDLSVKPVCHVWDLSCP